MRLGITTLATDRSMPVTDLAQEAEARGFSALYLPEHTHIPISRKTPYPGSSAELPEPYRRTVDPFVALAAVAAVTRTIRLGTGICLIAQRDPIVTAKAVATLDQVSAGRFDFGVGFGWNQDEAESHGVDFAHRRDIVRERVLEMKALWSEEVASFDGQYTHLAPSWSYPKPTGPTGPPILLGGAAGASFFTHLAEYADAWIPFGGSGIAAARGELNAALERAGREPASMRIVPVGVVPSRGKLDHFAGLGIDEVICSVPSGPRDVVLPALDEHAAYLQ